jgi:hypothetical protein
LEGCEKEVLIIEAEPKEEVCPKPTPPPDAFPSLPNVEVWPNVAEPVVGPNDEVCPKVV